MRQRVVLLGILLSSTVSVSAQTAYRVVPEESRFTVQVGTAGLFGFFGHDHLIDVEDFTGAVEWYSETPERSSFHLEVDASSLTVADEDVSEEDRKEIQSDMETKALALSEHPTIVFDSTRVEAEGTEGAKQSLTIHGTLSLRGVEESVAVPITITEADGRLTVSGEMELASDRWGVPQISVAGGTVKTDEDLELEFTIVAAPE